MASTNASGATERTASLARVAIISSGSAESTARISARSAGRRCAPLVQTASLRSRVARPCRRSSTTSGLRVSTGSLPQTLLAIHHSTEGPRSTEGRHGPAVQLQQHGRRVCCAHVKLLFRREMLGFSGVQFRVHQELAIPQNANVRTHGSRNGEIKGCIGGHGGGLLCGAIGGDAVPRVPYPKEK